MTENEIKSIVNDRFQHRAAINEKEFKKKIMKHLFVPYELMLGLEAKGFAEDCICGYNRSQTLVSKVSHSQGKDCECKWNNHDDFELRAATWSQVVDWFREKHDIDIHHVIVADLHYGYCLFKNRSRKNEDQGYFITPKEALTKAIEEALKLI